MVSIKVGPKEDEAKSKFHKLVNKGLWLIGTARNAILVVATGCIMYFLNQTANSEFHLIGDVPPGLPSIQMPPFSIPEVVNETTGEIITKGESFGEMVQSMGSFLIVIPLIALLEDISICKAFGKISNSAPTDRPPKHLIHSIISFLIFNFQQKENPSMQPKNF